MFFKVTAVRAAEDYTLIVDFANGERKIYDVKPLFDEFAAFRPLMNNHGLFESVRVDAGGYGIVWNDEIDLSCNELYFGGQSLPALESATARSL